MNPIKTLLETNEKVFVYLSDDEVIEQFVNDLHEAGINYPNEQSPYTSFCSAYMSVTKERVCHVAYFVWRAALRPSGVNNFTHPYDQVPMVDYGKMKKGEADWNMRK